MSNTSQRLILLLIALPILIVVIFFLPYAHRLGATLLILIFLLGCNQELISIFARRGLHMARSLSYGATLLIAISAYASTFPSIGRPTFLSGIVVASLLLFASFAFSTRKIFHEAITRSAAYSLGLLYVAILGSFNILIAADSRFSSWAFLAYVFIILANDCLSWLAGVTIGRGRGIFPVSPNKSLSGYLVGLLSASLMPWIFSILVPSQFQAPVWKLLLLGFICSIACNFGDLFESAIKRSAEVKDSGTAILGRGGFLDSFDSYLFTAPVFFILSLWLGIFGN